ncbi:hypothetical protein [Legionella oakridgensis]|nr:hypothetical protein [Legionella oakridgensis]ETO93414.1 hypothetical protein LOR_25c02050 [Legionella oakridgensis RV-2-2007]
MNNKAMIVISLSVDVELVAAMPVMEELQQNISLSMKQTARQG